MVGPRGHGNVSGTVDDLLDRLRRIAGLQTQVDLRVKRAEETKEVVKDAVCGGHRTVEVEITVELPVVARKRASKLLPGINALLCVSSEGQARIGEMD